MVGKSTETDSIGLRILDAGAGGQKYKQFCSHLNYVAQDFAQYNGKGNSKGLQMESWDQTKLDIVSDITAIPELDASFDAIMCIEVLEHLPEPIKAIQEFARLLKQGGILILTAPFCSLTHFAPYHFCTGFNRYFYEKILKENGFHILEIAPNGNYFEYIAQEIHRIPKIAKDFCNIHTSMWFRFICKMMLKWLEKFSAADRGSDEVLCFGYHVLARKQ